MVELYLTKVREATTPFERANHCSLQLTTRFFSGYYCTDIGIGIGKYAANYL